MEMNRMKRFVVVGRIISILSIISLICACTSPKIKTLGLIAPAEHTLITIAPDFTLKVSGDTINKSYPLLRNGKIFPIVGILRVDGKSYHFWGGDSLRILPLAALSGDSIGWQGKYSYLYPGKGWEKKEYNDSLWNEGEGAFGSLHGNYPVHTAWEGNNIFVRRKFEIKDKKAFEGHKLYARYICDDKMTLYCNGEYLLGKGHSIPQPECLLLKDKDIAKIVNGENVLAAHGQNNMKLTLLDFGLYLENRTYSDAEHAILSQTDVEATQTHYVFQCGDVELKIDFTSPSLSGKWDLTGWPVGFISYQINSKSKEQHSVDILFDVDMEWMFGKRKVDSWIEQDWRFVKTDSLYLGMLDKETTYSCDDGHVILSQKLYTKNKDKGVLIIGYEEGQVLQYVGECLRPLWKRDMNNNIKELMISVGNRYEEISEECGKIDYLWNRKAYHIFDKNLAGIFLPAYRNFISSHRFVCSPENKLYCFGDSLCNVREAYDSFPILKFYKRIDWMKALMNPIFDYCEEIHWKKKYPPYDIGLYPIASKQVMKDDHAVEVAANMLIMIAMIVELEQDVSYADLHWRQLSMWAEYLQESIQRLTLPSEDLLDENDERVKCVLGLKAYYRMIQYRRGND